MSVTVMHVEHCPSRACYPNRTYRRIADWLDERIRTDASLDVGERTDPRSVNLLGNLVIDDAGPFTTDRNNVEKFKEMVERYTESDHSDEALAAREIATAIAELPDDHDTLHLTLA